MPETTPCQDPENDPNDWFIERDGRQYSDEAIFTAAELPGVLAAAALDPENIELDTDELLELVTEQRLRENIRKRRHAKDLCHLECPIRTQCLQLGLSQDFVAEQYGIWGGYYTEELRAIQREGRARRRARE